MLVITAILHIRCKTVLAARAISIDAKEIQERRASGDVLRAVSRDK